MREMGAASQAGIQPGAEEEGSLLDHGSPESLPREAGRPSAEAGMNPSRWLMQREGIRGGCETGSQARVVV